MTLEWLAELALIKEQNAQLIKERDAAIKDLKQDANCDFCKWFIGGDCTDFEHIICHGENWEWRGVQNADS
ncbi:MAG: hypothetical protein KBT06_08640 [Prevotellaceae bacterium]|nr:hypothetical protein [Candidatus Colivivens equi]